MKNQLKFSLLVLLTLMAACSGYRYYAIQSSKVEFNKYRTFAWLPAADTSRNKQYNDIADERIREQVTARLKQCGLKLAARAPDLLVRYSVIVKDRVRSYNYPMYVYDGYPPYYGVIRSRNGRLFYYNYRLPFTVYLGDEIEKVPYKEGPLIVDLIDRRSGWTVWRGYAVGDINDPQTAVKDIPRVVDGILNKLPIMPYPTFRQQGKPKALADKLW